MRCMYLCVYFQVHVCMYISLEYMYVYGYVRACVSMDIQCVCRRMSCLCIYKRMCFFVLILALCKSFLTYKRCMGMRLSTKKQNKTKTKTKNKQKQKQTNKEQTGSYTNKKHDGTNLFAGWLLNVPATCECISGTDLLRQFYVLPH